MTCIGCSAFSSLQLLLFAYGRDQGIYAVVADTMLHGGMPYRDAWDFKPPGIFFIYAAAQLFLGRGEWAIRAFEVAGLLSMVFAFTILARRFFGDWRIGLVGGALGTLVHAQLEFWHTAQPESFGAILIAWALVAATSDGSGRRNSHHRERMGWVIAGALYGFAGLLKPPLAGCALVSAFFASRNVAARDRRLWPRIEPFVVMGLAGTLTVGLCALFFAGRGAFGDLYDAIFVFAPGYTKLGWQAADPAGALYYAVEKWLTNYSALNAVGILAAFLLPPLASREREGALHVLGVVAMQLVGVAMQGKFFPYHFGASLPLGGLLAGLGAWKLWARACSRPSWGVPAFAIATFALLEARSATRDTATGFLDRSMTRLAWLVGNGDKASLDAQLYSVADVSNEENRRVASLLRAMLKPSDRVFIWGFEPHIHALSERRPASRYIYNVPQRVAWARDEARATLMRELRATPPAAIVVERGDVFPMVTGDHLDSARALDEFSELAAFVEGDYELAAQIGDFDVYFARSHLASSTRDAD